MRSTTVDQPLLHKDSLRPLSSRLGRKRLPTGTEVVRDKSGRSTVTLADVPRTSKVFAQFEEHHGVKYPNIKDSAITALSHVREFLRPKGDKMDTLRTFLPVAEWAPKYNYDKLRRDALAGLTVGVMLIPQSMAYALLAGLPPIYGMYSSSFTLIVFALFSSSPHLSVGPVATTAILIGAAVDQYDYEPGSPEYVSVTVSLALLTGIIQLAMGLLRMGFVTKFLSRPVMSGFTTGAACIIAIEQCKSLFGMQFARAHTFLDTLVHVLEHLETIHGLTALISVISLIILLGAKNKGLKKYFPKWVLTTVPLLCIIVGILLGWGVDIESYGVEIVGEVPGGLAPFVAPDVSILGDLIEDAIILSLVSYMGSIALAQQFASQERIEIDANQELIAFGLTCIFASFNQSHTISGSFSRSAMNYEMDCATQASGFFTAMLMIISLLFLTQVFAYLPTAILGAMILVSVKRLIAFQEVVYLFKVKRMDLLEFWVCVLATLFVGIKEGIIVGMAFSLLVAIYRMVQTPYYEEGRLPQTFAYADIDRFPNALVTEGIIVLRFEGELFFGNGKMFASRISDIVREQQDYEAELESGNIGKLDSRRNRSRGTDDDSTSSDDESDLDVELMNASGESLKHSKAKLRLDPLRMPAISKLSLMSSKHSKFRNASLAQITKGDGGKKLFASSVRPIDTIIIDGCNITDIDSSAQRDLLQVLEEANSAGVAVLFAALPGRVRDVLDRADMRRLIGYRAFFVTVDDAVQFSLSVDHTFQSDRPYTKINYGLSQVKRKGSALRRVRDVDGQGGDSISYSSMFSRGNSANNFKSRRPPSVVGVDVPFATRGNSLADEMSADVHAPRTSSSGGGAAAASRSEARKASLPGRAQHFVKQRFQLTSSGTDLTQIYNAMALSSRDGGRRSMEDAAPMRSRHTSVNLLRTSIAEESHEDVAADHRSLSLDLPDRSSGAASARTSRPRGSPRTSNVNMPTPIHEDFPYESATEAGAYSSSTSASGSTSRSGSSSRRSESDASDQIHVRTDSDPSDEKDASAPLTDPLNVGNFADEVSGDSRRRVADGSPVAEAEESNVTTRLLR